MAFDPGNIKTIVVLMMENRSFDHMLGYLSLPPWNRQDVDGLRDDPAWLARFANPASGTSFQPFHLTRPSHQLPGDPPHDRPQIAIQTGQPPFPMNGFVQSCPIRDPSSSQPIVMGYFTGEDLPTTHFFTENFAICDRWFSAIPASTQPNRLMAMSGATRIDNNVPILPEQDLVYDWLESRSIRWRVYHQGLPFFALMPSWAPFVLMDYNFRDLSRLAGDLQHESGDSSPQVIFIEPRYTDAPHVLAPTDDHAPSPVSNGQQFLAEVYATLVSDQERWKNTVLIVTYDEHGGFFDHVSPIAMPTTPPAGAGYPAFATSGVRVPGFVISPWVEPGAVYKGNLDHTSVLKLIAEVFGAGSGYSPEVDARTMVGSVSAALTRATPRGDAPHPPATSAGFSPGSAPDDVIPQAFAGALTRLRQFDHDVTDIKFPSLIDRFKL